MVNNVKTIIMKFILNLLILLFSTSVLSQPSNKEEAHIYRHLESEMLKVLDFTPIDSIGYYNREPINEFFIRQLKSEFKKTAMRHINYDSIFKDGDLESIISQLKTNVPIEVQFSSKRIKKAPKDMEKHYIDFQFSNIAYFRDNKWSMVGMFSTGYTFNYFIFSFTNGQWTLCDIVPGPLF